MTALWIVLGVIAFLIICIVGWWITTYNALIRLRNRTKESFSGMDVYMKKRYDLIPNLVNTVKGYAKHEHETLEKVIQARNTAYSAGTIEEKQKAEAGLTNALKSLFALAESYPDLKANENFMDLQTQLREIETEIADSRRFYNSRVLDLNNKIDMFPSNIVAKHYKFEKEPMFELDSPEERKNVKVEF